MRRLSKRLNHFLSRLSSDDAALIRPYLRMLEWPQGTVLYKVGETVTRVYFPLTGIVSIHVGLISGEFVEVGTIGRNGVVGAGAALGAGNALAQAVVQVAIQAATIETDTLRQLATQSASLRQHLICQVQMMFAQAQQLAACNAAHELHARLCRSLSQKRDLLQSDILPLTHEIMSQMLGVHRTSVSLAAKRAEQSGLIGCRRSRIEIRDAEGLRRSACDCYQAMNDQFTRLIGWQPHSVDNDVSGNS